MTQAALALTLPPTSIRRRRLLMTFDSRVSALAWAVRNRPKHPPGAVTVCPPRAVKDGDCWVLNYCVTFPGHCKYRVLGKSGHLLPTEVKR